ncbi:Metallo-dependent hydrolase [Penicillium hetheringtonii]|uniref:Metallo-dependent hydrolase n=1 Tax=Penicillium hetheringtonii TaxID=911720 RepID=A0AAD6DBR9_9EURO|nr:Metallo-dependent hydrolase [Penicillium hetheringtonii]
MQSSNYAPEDVFWGELGGCLEAVDAGTTTLVDHAHINISPDHTTNAIEATVASGIRSVFCYTPTSKVLNWKPELTTCDRLLDDWVINQFEELASQAPFGDGRVHLGLAFDGFLLPRDQVVSLYNKARELGTKVITSHYAGLYFGEHLIAICSFRLGAKFIVIGNFSPVDTLESYGLLGPDILLSHATNLTVSDIHKLNHAKAWISTTPDTELQMGHGDIVCFREGCADICSLGIDCHSNNSGDMVSQMRLALQHERAKRNEKLIAEGKFSRSLNLYVQDVFRLATIQGARAIHMEEDLGSLVVGKVADLVVFDGESPGMICACEQDPVAAIVLHSSVRDIDMVIVDGQIRKQNSKLLPVAIAPNMPGISILPQTIEWSQVAKMLVNSRDRIENTMLKANATDKEQLVDDLLKMMHAEEGKFARL